MKIALLLALPVIGTTFKPLPPGAAKPKVEAACYACHSADIIVQQRLTEKQWTAEVEKMMRWGSALDEKDKSAVIAYLSKHFGAENKFTPTGVRPLHK